MSALLVVLFAFVAAGTLAFAVALGIAAAPERPEARIRARLTALRREAEATFGEPVTILKSARHSEIAWLDRKLAGLPLTRHLEGLTDRAELDLRVGTLLLGSLFGGLFVLVVLVFLGWPPSLGVLAGAAAATLPYAYLRRGVTRRLRRFLEQMPDGLDTISQGLQAGMGLGHTQVFLANEAPEPLKTEFSAFLQEMNLGLPLREALESFESRAPLHEMRLFSTALLVQREVGGSLAELLNKLADVIRDRFRIERDIRSLTAQNRMTAWIVCSLPPAITGLMFLVNPRFMGEVVGHPVGVAMVTAAAISWAMGALVFWRLLKIHI